VSTITNEFRAPTVARAAAMRAADGVIAGYIHSLAHTPPRTVAGAAPQPRLARLVAHAYECGASRSNGTATRRRPALRRVPSPA
jgi:hypothetical protein